MTTKCPRHILGRPGGFLIIASLAVLSSSAGCSSAPLTDSSNPSHNIFADLFASSRRPADAIAQSPDLSSSAAGQFASSQPQSVTTPLPPSQTGPQTTSAGASSPPPDGAINGPVVSGAATPPSEQSPATNADILRSIYQSMKEGDECQSPSVEGIEVKFAVTIATVSDPSE
jgi:hypothetical protein